MVPITEALYVQIHRCVVRTDRRESIMETKPVTKRKKTRIIVGILILLLVVAVILQLLTPVKKPVVTPTPSPISAPLPSTYPSIPEGVTIEKNFTQPSIPLTLTTAIATTRAFPIEQFKSQTGVIKEISSVVWSNLDGKDFLTYDKYAKTYEYSSPKTKFLSSPIVLKDALSKANEFFQSYGLTNLTPLLDTLQYYSESATDSEFSVSTEKNATIVNIPFAPTFSGFFIYADNHLAWSAEVFVTNNGEIIKAKIPALVFSFAASKQVNTLTTTQALESVTTATIIDIDDPALTKEPVQNLSKISITKAEVEYRLNTTSNSAAPYYRFSGIGTKKDGTQLNIQFILPASNSETN